MTPQTNITYLWRHQDTPNNSRTIANHFLNIIEKSQNVGNRIFGKFWKRRGPNNPEDLSVFWKSWIWNQYLPENMTWTFLNALEHTGTETSRRSVEYFWKSWIWDHYLSKNMKWRFVNMVSISIKKTWNANLVIRDQYLQENMKWIFCNMESISSKNH